MTQTGDPEPFRNCDGCTLCCKIMSVDVLEKPAGVWCQHCTVGSGCRIHATRPNACRDFYCGYLTYPGLDESWRPSLSRLVVRVNSGSGWIGIHVDPQRPDAWRKEPYYSKLKEFSRRAPASKLVVLVFIGLRTWAIYPDRDVDLGVAAKGDKAIAKLVFAPTGPRYEVEKQSVEKMGAAAQPGTATMFFP